MALTQISTAGVKDDAVTSGKIPANAVGSSELADNAVDTAAIADDAVTSAKLASSSVGSDALGSQVVTTANIANSAITSAKLASSSVDSNALGSQVVVAANIADQAVTLAKLPHGTSSNDGKFLRANNGADPSFETVTSTTINNNADNRVITGSGTANTLNGNSDLLWNGSRLDIDTGGTEDALRIGNSAGTDTFIRLGSIGTTADTHAVIKYDKDENYLSLLVSGESHRNGGILIANGGNVGIGVQSHDPLTALHVQGSNNGALRDVFTITNQNGSSGTEVGMVFECGADEVARISAANTGSDIGPLKFYTASSQGANPTEKMRLDAVGGLRINATGTVIADELFSVQEDGTVHELCGFRVNNQSHTKDMITMAHVANSGDRMFVRFKRTGSLTNIGSINTNPSQTAFNTSSDYRLKENQVLIPDGISRLKQLKPYRFNFKIEPDKTVDGFFAHEVTSIVPEAVSGVKDAMEVETYYEEGDTLPEGKSVGDPKTYSTTIIDPQGLDYAKFTPLLTAALQEEIAKREALEARVAALEAA